MMRERTGVSVLAPAEWTLGWAKHLLVIGGLMAIGVTVAVMNDILVWQVFAEIAAMSLFLPLYLWPAKVSFLEDGLAFGRYGSTRFVPYSTIARTEPIQRLGAAGQRSMTSADGSRGTWNIYTAVRIHLKSGATIDIPTSSEEREVIGGDQLLHLGATGRFAGVDAKARELEQAIDARTRDASIERPPESPLAAALVRGERTLEEWRRAIDAAAPPATRDAYREGEAPHEALWRLVEDEAAPREARAGAAFALRHALDDDGRARIRIAGEACASPKLRVALETAADADANEDRLVSALREASLPREE